MLISQDRNEVYITFGRSEGGEGGDGGDRSNRSYLRYLRNGELNGSYLKMQTYGPWDIRYRENMESLAKVLVAIILAAKRVA